MRLRLRNSSVALIGASLLSVALASCSGGSSSIPQTSQPQSNPSQPGNGGTTTSSLTIINIKNSDRSAVKSHGTIRAHVYGMQKPAKPGTTTQSSVVHVSNLQYFGGPLVASAHVYNAFVDSSPSTFGDVSQFQNRFSRSTMVHMLDEYVGATASNRYPWGGDFGVNYPAVTTLGDNDLLLIIHAVAAGVAGGGLNHVYNIFLPPGLNYCSTGTILPVGACNASPTSPNPAFCAFHGAVAFSDTGTTLFTVEPFSDTDFCGVDNFSQNPTAPTPNGLVKDSQYSALSHEQSETFTDPIPGSGWVVPDPFFPSEIGDLCAYIDGPFNSSGFVSPQNTSLDGKAYRIQFEYSNKQVGCNNTTP